jgi:hypothetical protein
MGVFDNVPNTTNARDFIGTNLDLEKQAKLRKQNEIEFAEDEKILNSSIFSTGVSHLQIFDGVGAVPTGLPPQKTCDIANCHPAVGMCTYAFDVTGSYGFKDIPLGIAIKFYAKGLIPGNALGYKPGGALNGAVLNSFVSEDGSISDESVYSDLADDGGYKFQNEDVEPDLSFTTCEAYDNYTSNQIAVFQGYGVVGDKIINDPNGGELDSSHCGTIANIMSDHLTQSSCVNGSYTLNSVAYSGTDYINWSTLS